MPSKHEKQNIINSLIWNIHRLIGQTHKVAVKIDLNVLHPKDGARKIKMNMEEMQTYVDSLSDFIRIKSNYMRRSSSSLKPLGDVTHPAARPIHDEDNWDQEED